MAEETGKNDSEQQSSRQQLKQKPALEEYMQEFGESIASMKTELRESIASIKTELRESRESIASIKTELNSISSELGSVKEMQRVHGSQLESMSNELESIKETQLDQGNKLNLLVDAVPGASPIPNVFVCGDRESAQRDGPSSTWTLVKANRQTIDAAARQNSQPDGNEQTPALVEANPEEFEGCEGVINYTYLLVSSAHCVHEIADAEEGREKRSVIHLCKNLDYVLQKHGDNDEKKAKVVRVGFHNAVSSNPPFDKNPNIDIAFLELKDVPPSILNDHTVPEISPFESNVVGDIKSTVGVALSSRINGSGVQYVEKQGMVSFIPNFMESGCSGTLMFGIGPASLSPPPKALGVFKGKKPTLSATERGWIVPFPGWTDVTWTDVTKQLRRFEKTIELSNGGAKLVPVTRTKHQSRDYYLTLEHRKKFVFLSKSNNSFGEDGSSVSNDGDGCSWQHVSEGEY